MRNYLLPEKGKFFKANMHCHSVLSDGSYTVEKLKEVYKRYGYSIVAFTDHNVLIDHSDLNDENFMAITGYEMDVNDEKGDRAYNHTPCTHINFYAKDPHNTSMPCFNPKYIGDNHADLREKQKYTGTPDYERSYKNVNDMIEKTCKEGFLACYNHPTWSEQDLDDYRNIRGCFAMEIYNHSCVVGGYPEYNEHAYDDMLRRGNRLFCIASDDNHDRFPEGHPRWDSCGGFIMIKAEKLEYGAIMDALEKGNFYASTGPEIYDIWTEGEEVHVKCSPVERVCYTTYGRHTVVTTGEHVGDKITEAVFNVTGLYDRYGRITLNDGAGHFAWSRAYYDFCKMENGRYDDQPFRK